MLLTTVGGSELGERPGRGWSGAATDQAKWTTPGMSAALDHGLKGLLKKGEYFSP